jgi:hypothetical protein
LTNPRGFSWWTTLASFSFAAVEEEDTSAAAAGTTAAAGTIPREEEEEELPLSSLQQAEAASPSQAMNSLAVFVADFPPFRGTSSLSIRPAKFVLFTM